jgi:hypothetical protein
MPEREPSHPPSEPQPALVRETTDKATGSDRTARLQLFGAMLLGLLLVAAGLYLWRRPRTGAADASPAEASSVVEVASVQVSAPDSGIAAAVAQVSTTASLNGLSLSDARVVSCHDKGTKKTAPSECDHVGPVEQALAKAIEQSASCVPASAGGGTIEYIADVSFARKRNPVSIALPKDGRSLKSPKALTACKSAVSRSIRELGLDGVAHDHQRYKIAITATYPTASSATSATSSGGGQGDAPKKGKSK